MITKLTLRAEKGFTLIELLIAIAIIGILVSIAIPQYAAYRRRSFEAQVTSDIKNAATAQQAYFSDNLVYKACDPCTDADLPGFGKTAPVTVKAVVAGQNVTLTATHASCGADAWTWDSVSGAIVYPPTPCE